MSQDLGECSLFWVLWSRVLDSEGVWLTHWTAVTIWIEAPSFISTIIFTRCLEYKKKSSKSIWAYFYRKLYFINSTPVILPVQTQKFLRSRVCHRASLCLSLSYIIFFPFHKFNILFKVLCRSIQLFKDSKPKIMLWKPNILKDKIHFWFLSSIIRTLGYKIHLKCTRRIHILYQTLTWGLTLHWENKYIFFFQDND